MNLNRRVQAALGVRRVIRPKAQSYPDAIQLVLLLCLMIAASGGRAVAQTVTGSIFGTVTDANGAVVANAAVTVTNVQTGQALTAQSNSSGNYIFPVVDPGSYGASATAAGFQTQTQRGIHSNLSRKAEQTTKNPGILQHSGICSSPSGGAIWQC